MNSVPNRSKSFLWGGFLIAIGIVLGLSFWIFSPQASTPLSDGCLQKYSLTSQSIDCDTYDSSSARLDSLQNQMQTATDLYISEKKASRVSIFVRDLVTKQYASNNEDAMYAPASLLKLPLALTYYQYSELQPSILTTSFAYTASDTPDDRFNYFTASTSLQIGQSYTVSDLLTRMVANSDNGAYFILLNQIEGKFFSQALLDLGIQIPNDSGVLDFVTVKSYAGIFRMLYNASYLNRIDSQILLTTMTKGSFKGIEAPLPASIIVADKFGERTVLDQNHNVLSRELHDCGIVYKTPDPYIVCIMTEGTDFNNLQTIISDLSLLVYRSV